MTLVEILRLRKAAEEAHKELIRAALSHLPQVNVNSSSKYALDEGRYFLLSEKLSESEKVPVSIHSDRNETILHFSDGSYVDLYDWDPEVRLLPVEQ